MLFECRECHNSFESTEVYTKFGTLIDSIDNEALDYITYAQERVYSGDTCTLCCNQLLIDEEVEEQYIDK